MKTNEDLFKIMEMIVSVFTSLASIISFQNTNTIVGVITAISAFIIISILIIKVYTKSKMDHQEVELHNEVFNSINSIRKKYKELNRSSYDIVEEEKEYVLSELTDRFGDTSRNKLKEYVLKSYELNRNFR